MTLVISFLEGESHRVKIPKAWEKTEPELKVKKQEKTSLRLAFERFYVTYRESFSKVQFPLEKLPFEIAHRFFLLDKAGFLQETFKTIARLRVFFTFYNSRQKALIERFSPQQQRTVFLATLLSDIGKTGPEHIGYQERCLHTAMFSLHNIPDPKISVHDFITQNYKQLKSFIQTLPKMDIERGPDNILLLIEKTLGEWVGDISMLDFYSRHVNCSFRIVSSLRESIELKSRLRFVKEKNDITAKVLAAIAGHHYLSGMRSSNEARRSGSNKVLGKTGYVSGNAGLGNEFRLNMPYSREMALVFLFDVYMAQMERSNSGGHTEVVKRMQANINGLVDNAEHRNMFQSLLGVMGACFGGG